MVLQNFGLNINDDGSPDYPPISPAGSCTGSLVGGQTNQHYYTDLDAVNYLHQGMIQQKKI